MLSRGAILWRAVLGRWRGVGGELRSLSDSEGSVSVCGEPVSPTNSRRNLNFDRKSCHTTYHPNSMKSRTHISVATITSTVRPTLCHIFLLPFSRSRAHNLHAESRTDGGGHACHGRFETILLIYIIATFTENKQLRENSDVESTTRSI